MIEAGVAASIALFTAIVSVHNRLHNKISDVDNRVDKVELRVAEYYVQKQELSTALQKMEDHMIRIENKLDQIALRHG
jgi:predicted  nucleic acid-binding Zn-ribbon protein